MKKWITVDFNKCEPQNCYDQFTKCLSVEECNRKLLEQEDTNESPILISTSLCIGCGACIAVCPYGALSILN